VRTVPCVELAVTGVDRDVKPPDPAATTEPLTYTDDYSLGTVTPYGIGYVNGSVVAAGSGGFTSLSTPVTASSTQGTVLTTGGLDNGKNLVVNPVENLVYVATFSGLAVVDVSTVASPTLTGSASGTASGDPCIAWDGADVVMRVEGSVVEVWDVSTPSSPSLAATVGSLSGTGSVAYANGHFVITGSSRVDVVDTTTPSSPSVVGGVSTTGNLNLSIGQGAGAGNYAYFADFTGNRLCVIDVSTPSSPSVAGSVTNATTLEDAYAVDVNGDYAYVYCRQAADRVTIVDVTTKSSPSVSFTATSPSSSKDARSITAVNFPAIYTQSDAISRDIEEYDAS